MSEWKPIEEAPQDTLILVYQHMTGKCLRSYNGEDWYDENEIWDDSELEITHFWSEPLPDDPQ